MDENMHTTTIDVVAANTWRPLSELEVMVQFISPRFFTFLKYWSLTPTFSLGTTSVFVHLRQTFLWTDGLHLHL